MVRRRDDDPADVVALLQRARRVVVLSGAGMSVASGIPTFRDAGDDDALWSRYDPMTMASPEAFEDEPDLVWGWYLWRIAMIRQATPNAGHLALGRLEGSRDVTVVTQNVDDLHERGGSFRVLHLHGRLEALRCFECAAPSSIEVQVPDAPTERVSPPTCDHCGGMIRPGVVWFGEPLPQQVFDDAVQALEDADLALVVGTSGVVYPAAGLPAVARAAGVPVVEINPQESAVSDLCDLVLRQAADEVLPALIDAVHP